MASGPAVIFASLLLAATAAHAADRAVDIPSRPNVTVRATVVLPEAAPRGSVVLLAGGTGILDIDRFGTPTADARLNHLVRTRALYAAAGFVAVVPDLAIDIRRQASPRESAQHAQDLGAVLAHAKSLAEPVFLVATSNGAVSAAAAMTRQDRALPVALVISSGALMTKLGALSAERVGNLDRIRVPVLLLAHERDTCRVSPPRDRDAFKALLRGAPKVDLVTLAGGEPEDTREPCSALNHHGFSGIDAQAVDAIVGWLNANR